MSHQALASTVIVMTLAGIWGWMSPPVSHANCFPSPCCGDGSLDGGEDCDDGNVIAGDCCSPTCTFEASDTIGSPPCCVAGACVATAICGTKCFTPGCCELPALNNSGTCTCQAGLCLPNFPPTAAFGAGTYTITQVAGGTLTLGPLPAFPLGSGGATMKLDVHGFKGPNCVYPVVVPFPGGFTAPHICIPSLGFTAQLRQRACGVGRLDINSGSDFTVTQVGDTSDTLGLCGFGDTTCTSGADSNFRADVTVGDGVADTCGSHCRWNTPNAGAPCTGNPDVASCGGSGDCIKDGNLLLTIPVSALAWVDADGSCPDQDGTFDPGTDGLVAGCDVGLVITTTDTATTSWASLDGDGCSLAGSGPSSLTATGACINLAGFPAGTGSLTMAAAGPVGSSFGPLYDILYATTMPATIVSTGPSEGSTCETVPVVPLGGGKTIRCVSP